jgi:hypothetical protein
MPSQHRGAAWFSRIGKPFEKPTIPVGHRGQSNKAFEWLNRAYEQRDPGIPELKSGPLLKNLGQGYASPNCLGKCT